MTPPMSELIQLPEIGVSEVLRTENADLRARPPLISIGGRGTRRGSAYSDLPIVTIALFDDAVAGYQSIFAAVDFLESVSGAFRVIVFSDASLVSEVRAHGWTFEHIMPERAWSVMNANEPWAVGVRNRARWIVDHYGVSLFASIGTAEAARRELWRLARTFQVPERIAGLALAKLGDGRPKENTARAVHMGWRGWLQDLVAGESRHEVNDSGTVWLDVFRGSLPNVIVAVDTPPEVNFEAFASVARQLGWSTARMSSRGGDWEAGMRSVCSALGGGGLKLVFGQETTVKSLVGEYADIDGCAWVDYQGDVSYLSSYGRLMERNAVLQPDVLGRLVAIRALARTLAQ